MRWTELVAQEKRKIHSKEFHNLYSLPNIVKVMTQMREQQMHTEFWLETLRGRDHFRGLGKYEGDIRTACRG
jgi:hypothetical protein